jgi:hypothetical protein
MDTNIFWDGFTVAAIWIVAILAFIDFLIGPSGRLALQKRIGDCWVFLAQQEWRGLMTWHAGRIASTLGRVTKYKWASLRSFIRIFLFSITFSWASGTLISSIVHIKQIPLINSVASVTFISLAILEAIIMRVWKHKWRLGPFTFLLMFVAVFYFSLSVISSVLSFVSVDASQMIDNYFAEIAPLTGVLSSKSIMITFVLLANFVFDYVSLMLTIYLLTRMARSIRWSSLLAYLSLDVVLALLLFAIVALITAFLHDQWLFPDEPWVTPMLKSPFSLDDIQFHTHIKCMAVTAALPTLIHLLIAVAFLLSKLARPILLRPTTLITQRFYESQRGILALMGASLAILAKAIQATLKYLVKYAQS